LEHGRAVAGVLGAPADGGGRDRGGGVGVGVGGREGGVC